MKTPLSRLVWAFIFMAAGLSVQAQVSIRQRAPEAPAEVFGDPPRLVVGIVVDQMRYDYLSRFWAHFGEDGFKRMIGSGFLSRNHHFNYAPTSTGPGHASVYTGAPPAVHGVIGNNWFDKASGQDVYCAGDSTTTSVGTSSDAGQHSPHRMMVTTVTDQLRLHHQMRSKVIAVSLKDRGAVLPGGHTANAAYWFEGGEKGHWISSSFYMEQLPAWVQKFNASDAAEKYRRNWEPAEDINTYLESGPDNTPYEGIIDGEVAPVFPHKLPDLWEANGRFGLLRITPYGNSLTTDFALEALKEEALGKDEITDFLAVSYSSTDYVGHWYGVNSKEVQDTYIRLDQDLARLLKELDRRVGKDAYTVFLTADHGAGEVPAYLADQGVPAGYLDGAAFREQLTEYLQYAFGTPELLRNISNNQVFLDHDLMRNLELDPEIVERRIAEEILGYDHIVEVYTAHQMRSTDYVEGLAATLQNGYNQRRSGDILFVTDPQYANYSRTGSTHGTPHIYDTQVPLILYGQGIRPGSTTRRTDITDIAPTMATLLGIAWPTGTTGQPIGEALR
ncbi:alkaline phosphatase family protein [Robiginitalea sp. M366]|uniref:alkaline phosphatase PafA n=1 Tax=Robiginitalea aestuariiviva TaxID=3036903 RepID=UPI00240E0DA2|nr:alkaline phosphatase PafA [Robiginitalea aestuariiviva]MDG1572063.1 alkaline phosphatase family protein [Robiginitalea aestuariiviva]